VTRPAEEDCRFHGNGAVTESQKEALLVYRYRSLADMQANRAAIRPHVIAL
jgi:hypothetical protein